MFQNADEAKKFIADEDVKFVDVRFCDLPGVMQHFTRAGGDRSTPHRGARLRRLLDPRLPGHPRVRHGAPRRPVHRAARPVPPRQDAQHQLLHPRPDHGRAVLPRPAQRREEGRGVPRVDRHRRHRVLRSRGRVLRLRHVRFETKSERGLLPHRLRGGRLEHRRAEEDNRGYKVRYKGGYFPVPPVDHFADLRAEIVPGAGRSRPPGRARSTTRWAPPARPRSTTSSTRCSPRPTTCMLFKYIVKNVAWRNGKTATFMPKPIFGDNGSGMHVHQCLWNGRRRRCSTTRPATPACRTPPATTSAASSSTPRPCWPSPTRR